MKYYAQIVSGMVKNVAVFESTATFQPEEGIWRDVTDIEPMPGKGWIYHGGTNYEPPAPEPTPRIISNLEFWERFTQEEQENFTYSGLKKVKWFLYNLKIRSSVDLDGPQLANAMNAAETAGLIGEGRAEEILL